VGEGPNLADVDELCAEFGFHYDDTQQESLEILQQMVAAAITRWRAPTAQPPAAQPAPPAPEVGEVGLLVDTLNQGAIAFDSLCNKIVNGECRTAACLHRGGWIRGAEPADPSVATCSELEKAAAMRRAATLLQRPPAPAPAVVPVSERPWDQEGWCDERGYCWRFDPCPDGWWSYGRPVNFWGDHEECWTHMAPHNAIPLPQAGEGES
jgi:hypothetical protein